MSDPTPAEVFAPGEFIKEELEARGWTQDDLAKILDKPLPTVNQIIKGKRAIIAETARRLGAAFGNTPEFWMNLEAAWQLHGGRTTDQRAVRDRARLYDLVPVREMERRGWLCRTSSSEQLESELMRFFGVHSLSEIPRISAAARASTRGELAGLTAAQWAWCRRACQVSQLVSARPWNHSAPPDVAKLLRPFMSEPEEVRRVSKILGEAGIRLVIVEHLSHTKLDGAALWPSADRPIIALSMRFGRIDYFWFTLLHELAHIMNGDGECADVEILESTELDEVEERANRAAAAWLVPPDKFDSFVVRTTPLYSSQNIANFSRRMGVHPSVIVGQLKRRGPEKGGLDWDRFARLHNVDVRGIIQEAAMCDGWGRVAPV